jgi:hypothetical protein
MTIQYCCFTSLVLHDVHGNCPIFPFDPMTGNSGNCAYHYHPSITIKELDGELGFQISHYQDNDSRRIATLECTDNDLLTEWPNLLVDAVEQGFAAWGGRTMSDADALALAQYLQPAREESFGVPDPDNPGEVITVNKDYGAISLDGSVLTRTVTIT